MIKQNLTNMTAVVFMVCLMAMQSIAQDVGDPKIAVQFECPAPSAKAVYLAGQFNNWLNRDSNSQFKEKENAAWLMKKDEFGNWKLTVKLPPGNYSYMFVVD